MNNGTKLGFTYCYPPPDQLAMYMLIRIQMATFRRDAHPSHKAKQFIQLPLVS